MQILASDWWSQLKTWIVIGWDGDRFLTPGAVLNKIFGVKSWEEDFVKNCNFDDGEEILAETSSWR